MDTLADLRAQLIRRLEGLSHAERRPGERRRAERYYVDVLAQLRVGELTMTGTIRDVAEGGLFLSTRLLVEVGEHGSLYLGSDDTAVPVRVVWVRGKAHEQGPGLGLEFEQPDPAGERLAIEF